MIKSIRAAAVIAGAVCLSSAFAVPAFASPPRGPDPVGFVLHTGHETGEGVGELPGYAYDKGHDASEGAEAVGQDVGDDAGQVVDGMAWFAGYALAQAQGACPVVNVSIDNAIVGHIPVFNIPVGLCLITLPPLP
jgi:hypothetical protein